MNPLSVLIADDEEAIRHLLEEWLKPLGHVVAGAANGTEAIKLLNHVHFDLVVTDMLMPEGGGVKLIEELKKIQPDASILVISGGGRYLDYDNSLGISPGLGADAAILKPFSRDKFLEAVGLALAAKKTSDV